VGGAVRREAPAWWEALSDDPDLPRFHGTLLDERTETRLMPPRVRELRLRRSFWLTLAATAIFLGSILLALSGDVTAATVIFIATSVAGCATDVIWTRVDRRRARDRN
jgi:hypothetical protein